MVCQEKINQVRLQIWHCCASTTDYLYQIELYLGKKDEVGLNLVESVVLKMCKVLEKSYCTVYFDNFFNSSLLISKLFRKGIYGVGTAQSNRTRTPALPSDKKMKRGDSDYKFSTDVNCCKWMDNIAYNMLHPDDLTFLNFQIAVATHMIGPYTSRKRAAPDNNIGSKSAYRYKHGPTEVPNHLPEFQQNHHRCVYCYAGGIERKPFVKCSECGVFLCLCKERNCQ